MTVSLTWATTNGGAAISSTVDHGSQSVGNNTTAVTLFLSHDGENPIRNCKLYIAEKSGTYSGSASATYDRNEMIEWGDNATEAGFGGVQINMDAENSFPAAAWGIYTQKDANGKGYTFRTEVGDEKANGVTLLSYTGASSDGVIDAGDSPDVSFQCRIKIPTNEAAVGTRQFDLKLVFTYTS